LPPFLVQRKPTTTAIRLTPRRLDTMRPTICGPQGMEASGSLAAGMGSPTRMEATTFTAAITGTAATADGHGGKGKVHFLVTICNNFAIPTSCGPKIFLAPNIDRPLSCAALRGRFAAASRGRRRTVSLAPATTLPIGCLSNRWPQIGVETHRLVQSSHQASRPRLSNADRHQVPRRKLASWAPCSYRVAIRSEVG
jgi:hypothetical protein